MKLEILHRRPAEASRKHPILFVHGAWHGAWCWDMHFLPYFAQKGFSAYAVSLRGHGNSECPERFSWIRIKDYVADLAQAADQLPEAPILVGHSMGGLVVQKYLEDHDGPAAVLLASVPIEGVFRTALNLAGSHPFLFLKANLTWSLYGITGTPELAREHFFSTNMPAARVADYFGRLQDESYLAFLDMLAFNLPTPRKVSANLLVLGAARDTIFGRKVIEKTAAAYHTRAEFFDGMAHDMMLEEGWQTVADRIIDWLDEKTVA